MFHPVTSLVSSVECVFAVSWSQLSIEVSYNNRYVIFAVCRAFLDCSVHVLPWWSAYPEWVKYTLISLMRWWFTTIVAVYSVSIFFAATSCSAQSKLRVCCHLFLIS